WRCRADEESRPQGTWPRGRGRTAAHAVRGLTRSGASLRAGADLLAVELLEGVVVGDGVGAALALDGLDGGLRGLDRGLGGLQLLRDEEGDQTRDRAEQDEHARDDEIGGPGRQARGLQSG